MNFIERQMPERDGKRCDGTDRRRGAVACLSALGI